MGRQFKIQRNNFRKKQKIAMENAEKIGADNVIYLNIMNHENDDDVIELFGIKTTVKNWKKAYELDQKRKNSK